MPFGTVVICAATATPFAITLAAIMLNRKSVFLLCYATVTVLGVFLLALASVGPIARAENARPIVADLSMTALWGQLIFSSCAVLESCVKHLPKQTKFTAWVAVGGWFCLPSASFFLGIIISLE